jgi:hypothetical protein
LKGISKGSGWIAALVFFAHGKTVSIGDYLATSLQDARLQSRQAGDEYRFGSSGGIPWIRDIEFKIRNEAFDVARQRYTLDFLTKGFGEEAATKQYADAQIRQSSQREKVLLNRALLDRYQVVLELQLRKTADSLYSSMIAVYEDRIRVLDGRKFSEDFDLNQLVEAESELTKLRTQYIDAKKDMEVLELRIASHFPAGHYSGLSVDDMVDIETVISEVEKSAYQVDSNHVYLTYLDQGLKLAEARFHLEQSESRQFLKSLSFAYDMGERLDEVERRKDGKSYDLSKAYILEATFKIPGLSSKNVELNRRKRDFLAEKEDVDESRRELYETMDKDIRDIKALVTQYRYLMARDTEVDAQASLKKYLQMPGVDPLILLSIKSGSLKNSLKIQEVKFGILQNYIRVMDATGRLSQNPWKNFLSKQGEEFAK